MINLGSKSHMAAPIATVTSIKVVGVGGAGLALLEHLTGLEAQVDLVGMHTDAQALMTSSAKSKVQLGRDAAKGLASGGNPALGEAAARETADAISDECENAQVVIVCAGLGGGTGSGAAPVVAEEAKKNGAVVFGLVNLPFASEGEKRRKQALEAMSRLGRHCAGVICFENDKMTGIAGKGAPVGEAFGAAASTMSQAVYAIARMVQLPAFMRVGLDELIQMFRGCSSRCQFGYGVGSGENRVEQAVEGALQHPLLQGGKILCESGHVLIHVTGGLSMRLDEVNAVVRDVSVNIGDSAHVFLGISTDPSAKDSMAVTVMSCTLALGVLGDEHAEDDSLDTRSVEASGGLDSEIADKYAKTGSKRGSKAGAKKAKAGQTQEELPLDQAMRGRFRDLDPTMVDGQDLDIPTFIRMRLRLN